MRDRRPAWPRRMALTRYIRWRSIVLPTVSAECLQGYLKTVFVALGAPDAAANRISSSLVLSNLVGHDSHGAIRVPQYVRFVNEGRIDPRAQTVVERQAEG